MTHDAAAGPGGARDPGLRSHALLRLAIIIIIRVIEAEVCRGQAVAGIIRPARRLE